MTVHGQGQRYVVGPALIAPGNYHMVCAEVGQYCPDQDGPPVHHQRPAVDVLFHSVARKPPQRPGVFTGMGADGARTSLTVRAGAYTISQDEASCVVYGMPARRKSRRLRGGHEPDEMPRRIIGVSPPGTASGGISERRLPS